MAAVRAPSLETILDTSRMENVRLRIRLHSATMADFVDHPSQRTVFTEASSSAYAPPSR